MDIPLCDKPTIILNSEADFACYRTDPSAFSAAIAPDGAACARWQQTLENLPIGMALACPPVQAEDEGEIPRTFFYIDRCKQAFRGQLQEDADFYYLHGAAGFFALRAAVIALGELTGRTILAEIALADEEGRLEDGTDVCAAVGVLQRIGVTTVILTAPHPAALSEALERVAPYARLPVGVSLPASALQPSVVLYNTELFLPVAGDSAETLHRTIRAHDATRHLPRDHDDFIIAPDGRNAHFIDATIDISDEIICSPRLSEDLLAAEDTAAGAFKLLLETEEDVCVLEEHRYMISRPICLCASSAALLEQGLRVYPGLALYDGTWEQPEDLLRDWEQKYGLIRL